MTAKGRYGFSISHRLGEVLIYKEKSVFDFSKRAFAIVAAETPDVGAVKYYRNKVDSESGEVYLSVLNPENKFSVSLFKVISFCLSDTSRIFQ